MRVLALANQKGGVGKTTTAINLGTALAAIGEKVLIVDLDPQGNASTGLGIDRKNRKVSTYDVLTGERRLIDAVVPTAVPRLWIAPSTLDLLGVELEIANSADRTFRIRKALSDLAKCEVEPGVEITYVLFDCPPSLNLLTINALAAADSVVVPLQCEFFALEGLAQARLVFKAAEQNNLAARSRLAYLSDAARRVSYRLRIENDQFRRLLHVEGFRKHRSMRKDSNLRSSSFEQFLQTEPHEIMFSHDHHSEWWNQ